MSTGLHASRQDLHLPHVTSAPSYLHGDASSNGAHGLLPKPLSLSPRTFGMEDLRDFCGPLGSFKTGLTPRVFSTGLTPRSGFTPRFTTGFTPRIATNGLGGPDTNSFFSRNTGFSPPRQNETVSKISPTGFTPKDMSGMKVPMRFPGTFTATPQKMEHHHHQQQHQQQQPPLQMNPSMQHKQMHAPPPQQHQQQQHHMPHMGASQQQQQSHHHHQQHAEMNHMNMMYDYMHHRPTIPPQQHQQSHQQAMMAVGKPQKSESPVSEEGDPEDMDERRRMKNRERVRKCRKRKQDRLNFLEDRTAELEQENGHLKAKLARKSVGAKTEPLSEAQVKELRKKQNTTLAAYVRIYNENADPAGATSVWATNAEIIYGNCGTSVAGIDSIIATKSASASVFSQYKIKNYHVQWKENSQEKCLVHWEIDAVVNQNAPKDVPLTAPFAELSTHYAADEVITVHAISHLTFEEGKIVEEIRQLNLAQMAESVLSKFAAEAGKASEILRCLMKA